MRKVQLSLRLISLLYSFSSCSLNEPIISFITPLAGKPRIEESCLIRLDVDVSSVPSVRSHPDYYLVCFQGVETLPPSLKASSVCFSLFESILYPKVSPHIGEGGFVQTSVWLQHRAHLREPQSKVSEDAIQILFLWSDSQIAIHKLQSLLVNASNHEKAIIYRHLALAYQQKFDQRQGHDEVKIEHDQLGRENLMLHRTKSSSHQSLLGCQVINHFLPNNMALRIHFERKPKHNSNIRQFQYLKTSLPFPLEQFQVHHINKARELIEFELYHVCLASIDDFIGEDWKVNDCLFDLLDQYSQRIESICTPIPQVKSSCHMRDEKKEEEEEVDLSLAYSCLKLTHDQLSLKYPIDAEQHYVEIKQALEPWLQKRGHIPHRAAGYSGPWIENAWIDHFTQRLQQSTKNYIEKNNTYSPIESFCLREIYGPFVPILLPWTDLWQPEGMHRMPPDLLSVLRAVLRVDVPYITLLQHDTGFAVFCEADLHELFPNLLVMSAGGYGHVPIPLLKQTEHLNNHVPIEERSYLVSYVGGAVGELRQRLVQMLHNVSEQDWRKVMAQSRFSLTPRGFGRTSYHLMETLQMGLIPIHVHEEDEEEIKEIGVEDENETITRRLWEYDNEAWVPYEFLYHDIKHPFGFSISLSNFQELISKLKTFSSQDILEMELKISSMKSEYFTSIGVMKQIEHFMTRSKIDNIQFHYQNTTRMNKDDHIIPWRVSTNESDLVCRKLPNFPTRTRISEVFLGDKVIRMKEPFVCAALLSDPQYLW